MHQKKSSEEALLFRYLFIVGEGFAKAGKALPAEKPDGDNTDFIQYHQRDSHHHLVNDIRSRSDNSGDNKINEKGILSVAIEKGDIYQTRLGKKNHKNRHLKNDTEGQQQSGSQIEIFAHRRQRGEKFVIVTDQKFESRRKDDKIAEGGATDKTTGGKQGKGNENPLFMSIKTWSDKTPKLSEDDRRSE